MPSAWEPLVLLALYIALDLAIALSIQRPAARASALAARARRAAAGERLAAKAAASPATFAASAKHERRALAFEREADRVEAGAAAATSHPLLKRVATVKAVAGLALAYRWWGRPVLAVGAAAAWPLPAWWAAAPHARSGGSRFGGGGIAALPWSAIASRASAALARAVVTAVS